MRVLLISTYELGRQPFGLAEPAAWLREAGAEVACLDLAVEPLNEERVRGADLLAFHLPMHTATRLALAALDRIRTLNPTAPVCFYGLYAPPNEAHLRQRGAVAILGGEFETGLVSLVRRLRAGRDGEQEEPVVSLDRQAFRVPDRSTLPPLDRYARLILRGGEERLAGYVEASRGCKHLCRHCPVVPVYRGRFRVVQREVVLEDVRQQVAAGAEHITFGDPDFLNGPGHAVPLVEAFHREFPGVSYDVTAKVEHLLRHAALIPMFARTGCLFVTTAVESADDRILAILDKGHSRADFERVVEIFNAVELDLAPTFIPFTPWTSRGDYVDLLRWLARLELIDRVAPVQLAIRLLLPSGSHLLELPEVREIAGPLDPRALLHPWSHADGGMDDLAEEARAIVEEREAAGAGRREIFEALWRVAHRRAGRSAESAPPLPPDPRHPLPPRMSEPWYCCAEPTERQTAAV